MNRLELSREIQRITQLLLYNMSHTHILYVLTHVRLNIKMLQLDYDLTQKIVVKQVKILSTCE